MRRLSMAFGTDGNAVAKRIDAAPAFLVGTLIVSLCAVYFVNFVLELCGLGNERPNPNHRRDCDDGRHSDNVVLVATSSFTFRDGYRATTYGVPDLVDIVRLIDARLDERQKIWGRRMAEWTCRSSVTAWAALS